MPGHRTCYFYSFQGLEELLSPSKPGFLWLSSQQNSIANAFKSQTPTSKTVTPVSINGIDSLQGQQMPFPCSYSFDAQEMRNNLILEVETDGFIYLHEVSCRVISVLEKLTYSNQLPLNY